MKTYEELARLRANEVIKNGLESQRYGRLSHKDKSRASGSAYFFILALVLVLAGIAAFQIGLIH
jgi:hypothetical protein